MTPSIDKTLHQFLTITDMDLITEFEFLPNCARFPYNICNGCGMPTEDAYSSGHLVLSHFGTCMFSNVETNLSLTCLVSGLLNFEHPSVLLVWFTSFATMHELAELKREVFRGMSVKRKIEILAMIGKRLGNICTVVNDTKEASEWFEPAKLNDYCECGKPRC